MNYQVWRRGSLPPPGEYEYSASTGGRSRVWVGEVFVFINGEPKTLEQIFATGELTGPIDE